MTLPNTRPGEELTFQRAQRLLRERGEDMALRRSNPGDYLLSGLIRCGRCRRAYVGASARGNGGLYHYYACSGRQKLGRKRCDGERILRDKLEAAVIHQLATLYRDGNLIRDALEAATAKAQEAQPALAGQRRAIIDETRRAERALARYYTAFENGDLDATRFEKRVSSLETRLDALREQDAASPNNSPHKPRQPRTRPRSRRSPTTSKPPSPRPNRGKRKPCSDC